VGRLALPFLRFALRRLRLVYSAFWHAGGVAAQAYEGYEVSQCVCHQVWAW